LTCEAASFDLRCERAASFFLAVAGFLLFAFFQGLEGALLWREQQLGQRLVTQGREDEENNQCRHQNGRNVEQAP
jgi:hypothetical protein